MTSKDEQEVKKQKLSKEKVHVAGSHHAKLLGTNQPELPGIPVGPTKVVRKYET